MDSTEVERKVRRARLVGAHQWIAFAVVVLGIVGFALATPRFAAPDESAHQATAWYVTEFGLPPSSEGTSNVPSSFTNAAQCLKFDGRQDASCLPARQFGFPIKERILNYPPLYYWVIGTGQQVAAAVSSDLYLDVGGRFASLALNLSALFLIALSARRHYGQWGTYLLLIVTPMVAFLWAAVNPSGWEVSAGLLFAYFFANGWWRSEHTQRRLWLSMLAIAITSIIFALSRHSAIVWMAGLVIAVAATRKYRIPRVQQWKLLAATLPGFLSGFLWQLNFPARHPINNPDRVENPGPLDFAHYLMQIEEVLPDRLRQMLGVLGSLDTPVPQFMLFLVLIGWAAFIGFLFARTRIPIFFLVVGFVGVFLIPSLLEMVRWNDWPYWYQGRITLPFAVPFLFVLLMKYASKGVRAATALSVVTGLVLTFMVWQNLMRYSFGVWDYIPERWSNPAISDVAFWLTYLCIAAMLTGVVYLLLSLLRTRSRYPVPTEEGSAHAS